MNRYKISETTTIKKIVDDNAGYTLRAVNLISGLFEYLPSWGKGLILTCGAYSNTEYEIIMLVWDDDSDKIGISHYSGDPSTLAKDIPFNQFSIKSI